MKRSQSFVKTLREAPADEVSRSAQLLLRAGYIYKEMAGVYDFLPLGRKVLNNIIDIIREEMIALGGLNDLLGCLVDDGVVIGLQSDAHFLHVCHG